MFTLKMACYKQMESGAGRGINRIMVCGKDTCWKKLNEKLFQLTNYSKGKLLIETFEKLNDR